jgi:hypothetical protein
MGATWSIPYTGLLLIILGFGLGARNWLSLLICASSHCRACSRASRSKSRS